MQLIDRKGNKLVKLHRISEELITKIFLPLTHSLVVAIDNGNVVFVYNNWKKEWELPGGIIEENETPRECLIRELCEETGKNPKNLKFHSVMEWHLGKDQHKEYGALYTCEIEGELANLHTEEIGKIIYWDLRKEIGDFAELDKTLAQAVLSGNYI